METEKIIEELERQLQEKQERIDALEKAMELIYDTAYFARR